MNLLLLEEADFVSADRVVLADRRFTHMQEIHRVAVGDTLRVGRLGGLMGQAVVLRLEGHEAELSVEFTQPPPAIWTHSPCEPTAVKDWPADRLPVWR